MKDLIRMKKTGELTFRRIRKDETLGEEIVFEMGPDGKATRFTPPQQLFDAGGVGAQSHRAA